MGYVKGLKCRECGRHYATEPIYVCEFCFGSLEVDYDYDAIKKVLTRQRIQSGPSSLWRYRDLLPIDGEPTVGFYSGFTPLVRADRLARELGVKEIFVKDDTVCHPTWSFKDRVVAVALSKAKEFGFDTVACASTGNLANAVSAHGAWAGLKRYIFIPHDLERAKVFGTLVTNVAKIVNIKTKAIAADKCSFFIFIFLLSFFWLKESRTDSPTENTCASSMLITFCVSTFSQKLGKSLRASPATEF